MLAEGKTINHLCQYFEAMLKKQDKLAIATRISPQQAKELDIVAKEVTSSLYGKLIFLPDSKIVHTNSLGVPSRFKMKGTFFLYYHLYLHQFDYITTIIIYQHIERQGGSYMCRNK